MAAQAVAVGMALLVLSLELLKLKPQAVELDAKRIASHPSTPSKSPAIHPIVEAPRRVVSSYLEQLALNRPAAGIRRGNARRQARQNHQRHLTRDEADDEAAAGANRQ